MFNHHQTATVLHGVGETSVLSSRLFFGFGSGATEIVTIGPLRNVENRNRLRYLFHSPVYRSAVAI